LPRISSAQPKFYYPIEFEPRKADRQRYFSGARPARKGDVVDDYFGTKVADPYRWMEDLDSPETRAWVEAEDNLTFGFLKTRPERRAMKQIIRRLSLDGISRGLVHLHRCRTPAIRLVRLS
jgi:hypothetical protein